MATLFSGPPIRSIGSFLPVSPAVSSPFHAWLRSLWEKRREKKDIGREGPEICFSEGSSEVSSSICSPGKTRRNGINAAATNLQITFGEYFKYGLLLIFTIAHNN